MRLTMWRKADFYPYAVCITKGCDERWPIGRTSRDRAKTHARHRGHHVEITQETVSHWAPSDYDFKALDKDDDEIQARGMDVFKG